MSGSKGCCERFFICWHTSQPVMYFLTNVVILGRLLTHTSKKRMSPNFENTTARPDNTALSIQRGCPPSHASTESSHSSSPSLIDDSPPSDCDYAERVAVQNNMDIVDDNTPPSAGSWKYDFAMPPSQTPHAPHEDTLNEPSSPMVIPYSTNVPADPNLWNGNFTATSLFSTNKFLQNDVRNIACSLQRMACFFKQWSLKGHDGNNIPQLELFGKSA